MNKVLAASLCSLPLLTAGVDDLGFCMLFTQIGVNTGFVLPVRTNIPDMTNIRLFRASARSVYIGALVALFTLVAATSMATAAPKSDLWPRWEAHDPASIMIVDHGSWSRLLGRYARPNADGVTRFDYAGLRDADRPALDGYVAALSATPVSSLNRGEQLAYWINFYNALTVQVILDHYPTDSILDIKISPGFFSIGPWDKKLVTVEGEELSLNDMEHRILRPIWRDPRIHYGVNCASIGCPNLLTTAYTADNVDGLLTENAVAYVNHPRGASLQNGALTVSSIYDWFEEDFGGNETGILAHLRQYAKPDFREQLRLVLEISDFDYDWSLNDVDGPS